MKKKLTMINNIVCAILLIATFVTMTTPCWNFETTEKIKIRVCKTCGSEAELVPGTTKLVDNWKCTGTLDEEQAIKQLEKKLKDEAKEAAKQEQAAQTETTTETTEPTTETTTETTTQTPETPETPAPDANAPDYSDGVDPEDLRPEDFKCAAYKTGHTKLTYKEETHPDSASVMEFTWLAFDNKGLTKFFEEKQIVVNDVILAPFLLTLCMIAGVISCLLNMKGCWHSFFPLIGGGIVAFTYLTNPLFQQGSYWQLTLGCSIALAVAGLALFVQMMTKVIKWFVVPCYKK